MIKPWVDSKMTSDWFSTDNFKTKVICWAIPTPDINFIFVWISWSLNNTVQYSIDVQSPVNSLREWGRWTAPVTWSRVNNTPACINRRCIHEDISETNDGEIKVAKHSDCGERKKDGERKSAKKSRYQGARQRRRAKKGNYWLPAQALITVQGVKLDDSLEQTLTETNIRTTNIRSSSPYHGFFWLAQNDTHPLDLFWFLTGLTE